MDRLYFSGFEKLITLTLYLLGKIPRFKKLIEHPKVVGLSSFFFTKQAFSASQVINECGLNSMCIDILAEYVSDAETGLLYLNLNHDIVKAIPLFHDLHLALKPSAFVNSLAENRINQALHKILEDASNKNLPVIFDAEDRETNLAFLPTLKNLATNGYIVGSAFQLYWKDIEKFIEPFSQFNKTFHFRLVKGAYYDREKFRYPSLLHSTITDTTKHLLDLALNLAKSSANVAVGTHDRDLIMELTKYPQFELQFLYGIGSGFYRMLTDYGQRTRVYTPFYFLKELILGRPEQYLLRRLQENTDPYSYASKLLKHIF